jgi:uptake hydrogenase large subunit
MKTVVVGPFNRVEGDLEVRLSVEAGVVREARVCSSLYRGFERMLPGKAPLDALVLVPRICGICSVAQSMAAAQALAQVTGQTPPPNGLYAQSLTLAAENLADHLTHFYLFFMPDFAREGYAGRPWHAGVRERFEAIRGAAAAEVLAARASFLELMGLFAGKWPHTLSLQPGGSSRALTASDKLQALVLLRTFRTFLEKTLFGAPLEQVAALGSVQALDAFAEQGPPGSSDLRRFLRAARELRLEQAGRASDAFLSHGAYQNPGGLLFARGLHRGGAQVYDSKLLREDSTSAWLHDDRPRHPLEGKTQPDADKEGAYTWCKAPRLAGEVYEVGALARQMVHGHPLVRDLVARSGGSVLARVVARLLELALVVPEMEKWVKALVPGEPFCAPPAPARDGQGEGLVEAARGALGHWLTVEDGKLAGYQIVAPTTWNFSPRDASGAPGPLERALVGLPAEGEGALLLQHVVRSFDPCMVCTVH